MGVLPDKLPDAASWKQSIVAYLQGRIEVHKQGVGNYAGNSFIDQAEELQRYVRTLDEHDHRLATLKIAQSYAEARGGDGTYNPGHKASRVVGQLGSAWSGTADTPTPENVLGELVRWATYDLAQAMSHQREVAVESTETKVRTELFEPAQAAAAEAQEKQEKAEAQASALRAENADLHKQVNHMTSLIADEYENPAKAEAAKQRDSSGRFAPKAEPNGAAA